MKKISEDILNLDLNDKPDAADPNILRNLLQRRKVYGDVTQNVSNEELETLLRYYENIVPKVIAALEIIIEDRGYIFFNIAITSFYFLSWRFSLLFLYQLYQEHLYFLLK